jgi:hypothetical protein
MSALACFLQLKIFHVPLDHENKERPSSDSHLKKYVAATGPGLGCGQTSFHSKISSC